MRRILTISGPAVVDGIVDLSSHGEVIIDDKRPTSVDGICACGDLATLPHKQIIVSMGEGAKATLAAFEYLLMSSMPADGESKQAA